MVALAACTSTPGEESPATTDASTASPTPTGFGPAPVELGGLQALAHVDGTTLRLHTTGGDVTFWAGVRLTGFVPGTEAGTLAGTAAHYRRWYGQMRDFGSRVVLFDRLHPPVAYTELARHNSENQADPLYVLHVVSLPGRSSGPADLFGNDTEPMKNAVTQQVAALMGTGAGGYSTDVSPWLAAMAVDLNWGATRIEENDRANRRAARHAGEYVASAEKASPTEHWLAARLDELATLLAGHKLTIPLAAVNQPETDVLRHPREQPSVSGTGTTTGTATGSPTTDATATPSGVPSGVTPTENSGADVRPANIVATAKWPGGVFAYYDAPPHRSEFLAADQVYGATSDPYLAYLAALRDSLPVPLMVGSVGVSSSLGSGNPGAGGRKQGDHNETDKFAAEAGLVDVLARDEFAGGMFAYWHDDWSARTWNTDSRANVAGRYERPIVDHDPLTADQWGGVVAFDARQSEERVMHESTENGLQRVLMHHDASWLYLTLEFNGRITSPVEVGFDLFGDGGVTLPGGSGEPIHDAALRTVPTMSTTYLMIRAILDPLQLDGVPLPIIPASGHVGWHLQRLLRSSSNTEEALSNLRARDTDESGRERRDRQARLRYLDVGDLKLGSFDPKADDYDSRATWNMSRESGTSPATLRYRVPWGLIGVLDPPQRRALDFNGAQPSMVPLRAMTVTVESSTPGSPIDFTYSLPSWSAARYSERLKVGADTLSESFRRVSEPEARVEASPTPVTPTTTGGTTGASASGTPATTESTSPAR